MQLDFLPCRCDACGGTFCAKHKEPSVHHCPAAMECAQVDARPVSSESRYTCSLCADSQLYPAVCPDCSRNFCLKHRNFLDHDCSGVKGRTAANSRGNVHATATHVMPTPVSANFKKPEKPLSEKNKERMRKINLMKLKMHANGDPAIAENERIYFMLVLPESKTVGVFTRKDYSVGKTIDVMAKKYGIENKNNTSATQLCLSLDGDILKMQDAVSTSVCDGDTLNFVYSE